MDAETHHSAMAFRFSWMSGCIHFSLAMDDWHY